MLVPGLSQSLPGPAAEAGDKGTAASTSRAASSQKQTDLAMSMRDRKRLFQHRPSETQPIFRCFTQEARCLSDTA
jgi:hypothetical protein